jgi:hypothetical protein
MLSTPSNGSATSFKRPAWKDINRAHPPSGTAHGYSRRHAQAMRIPAPPSQTGANPCYATTLPGKFAAMYVTSMY